jgi:predicted phosphodiesterase
MHCTPSVRIAVLADVHANLPALVAALADARQRGCKRIYHAGDLIAIGPYPSEVVDLARAIGLALS